MSVIACPTTEIGYTYDFHEQAYSNIDTKPFLMDSSAKAYVRRFGPGEMPLVRVDPERPERSVLRESDQLTQQCGVPRQKHNFLITHFVLSIINKSRQV
jgi:hypothetical protein